MSDSELQRIVGKLRQLEALRRARARVRQLERELSGERARPAEPPYVPEFLRQRATVRIAAETENRPAEARAPSPATPTRIGQAA
jgi:hypothetical protein